MGCKDTDWYVLKSMAHDGEDKCSGLLKARVTAVVTLCGLAREGLETLCGLIHNEG